MRETEPAPHDDWWDLALVLGCLLVVVWSPAWCSVAVLLIAGVELVAWWLRGRRLTEQVK